MYKHVEITLYGCACKCFIQQFFYNLFVVSSFILIFHWVSFIFIHHYVIQGD